MECAASGVTLTGIGQPEVQQVVVCAGTPVPAKVHQDTDLLCLIREGRESGRRQVWA